MTEAETLLTPELSPEIEGLFQKARDAREVLTPFWSRVINEGIAEDQELRYAKPDTLKAEDLKNFADTYKALSVQAEGLEPKSKLDEVGIPLLKEKFEGDAKALFPRPLYPLPSELYPPDVIGEVERSLRARDLTAEEKQEILRDAIESILKSFPQAARDTIETFTAVGLDPTEKEAALNVMGYILNKTEDGIDPFLDNINSFWNKSFKENDKSEELPPSKKVVDLVDAFRNEYQSLKVLIERHDAKRDPRWGKEEVDNFLDLLGISIPSDELLKRNRETIRDLEEAMDKVAKVIKPEASGWQEVWGSLEFDRNLTSQQIIDVFKTDMDRIIGVMTKNGYVPPLTEGNEIRLSMASIKESMDNPFGVAYPTSYQGKTTVDIKIPNKDAFSQEEVAEFMRNLFADKLAFLSHELTHPFQMFNRGGLPFSLTDTEFTKRIAAEGGAEFFELEAYLAGMIKKTPENLLPILLGRLRVAARMEAILTYHLSSDSDKPERDVFDEVVKSYTKTLAIPEGQASADLARGVQNPFYLLAYQIGLKCVEELVRLGEKNGMSPAEVIFGYMKNGGGLIRPHQQAYLMGWIAKIEDFDSFSKRDRAVEHVKEQFPQTS